VIEGDAKLVLPKELEPAMNIWVALLHVKQYENRVGKDLLEGAYTNGIALAKDPIKSIEKMRTALHEMGFELDHVEKLDLWETRFPNGGEPSDQVMLDALRYVKETGAAEFGEFYCY
jgi:hypothetical protein